MDSVKVYRFTAKLDAEVLTIRNDDMGFHFTYRKKLIVTGSFIPSDNLDTLKAQNGIPKETWACLVYITDLNCVNIGQFAAQTCEQMFARLFKIMLIRQINKC